MRPGDERWVKSTAEGRRQAVLGGRRVAVGERAVIFYRLVREGLPDSPCCWDL